MRALAAAQIKAVPTGLAHGTVTAVVAAAAFRDHHLAPRRRDLRPPRARRFHRRLGGRRGAARFHHERALPRRRDGNVFDPVGGLADLRAGACRFVGDAATRIREDVLRLLRFYRFHAHYGRGAADAAARAACRALAHAAADAVGRAGRGRDC